MGHRKRLKIVFALLLVLGVFINSALTWACFCGQDCMDGFQSKSNIHASFLFHMRCLGSECKSCDLEDDQKLKAIGSASPFDPKFLDTVFIFPSILDDLFTDHVLKNSKPFRILWEIQSLPIYLQKGSLLC
jgi:hypothetical protein